MGAFLLKFDIDAKYLCGCFVSPEKKPETMKFMANQCTEYTDTLESLTEEA